MSEKDSPCELVGKKRVREKTEKDSPCKLAGKKE
jgi:hypothetical protein